MRFFKKISAVLGIITILAATSLAGPMCGLCSASAAQHHGVKPAESAHDHCGAAHSKSASEPVITGWRCGDNHLSCMVASDSGKPAVPSASSTEIFFGLAALAIEGDLTQSDFPHLSPPPNLRPTSLLLTTKLRI